MKIKTAFICMVAVLVLAVTPVASMAQTGGFQIGIAQPPVGFLPTQAPAIATRAPFVNGLPAASSPIVIVQPAPNPVFVPNQIFTPNPVFIPNPGLTTNPVFGINPGFIPPNPVFIPNPNPGFIPNQFILPTPAFTANPIQSPAIVPPTQLLVPGQTVVPSPTAQPMIAPAQPSFGVPIVGFAPGGQRQMTGPAPGTSRADVLRQFGQPSVTVTTSTGETLYFDGGMTVTLQNGQVAGPR